MSNNQTTRITTGEVRLSFVHLFKPYAHVPGQEEKFSTTVLVPKTDVATKQAIDKAIELATQNGVKDKWNGVRPPVINIPIYDGDGVKPSDGMPFGDECKGHWVFTASAKAEYPPEVVDQYVQPIINHSEVYSGIYARVNVNFYPYAFGGKKGIGCGLGAVQKVRDGEALGGGRVSAVQAFGQPTQAPVQQANQAVQQQQPPNIGNWSPQQAPQQYDPITGAPAGGIMGM